MIINEMLNLTTLGLLWIITITFLCYIPVLWYLDIRHREIDHRIWVWLFLIGTPITAWMYITGLYPINSLVLSIVMVAIFYFAYLKDYLQGADFMYLFFISVFWVINPIPVPHGLMQILFYIYLMATLILTASVVLIYNYWKGYRWGLIEMMSTWPGGVPFVIPISIAFLASLVII